MVKKAYKYKTDLTTVDGVGPICAAIICSTQVPLLSVASETNTEPEGIDQNTKIPVRVTGTKKYGITARHIILVRIEGEGATAFRIYRRVPIFTPEFFVKAISSIPNEIDYEDKTDWLLAGAQNERYRLTSAAVTF